MRPIIALLLAASILLGMRWFLAISTKARIERAQPTEIVAAGDFQLDVLLTFDAGPDPFSLNRDDAPSIVIEHRGKTIVRETEPIAAGTLLTPKVDGLVEGLNEFYVIATPQDATGDATHAVRVRVIRDGVPIAKSWLDSAPGEAVEGKVTVDVYETSSPDHSDE